MSHTSHIIVTPLVAARVARGARLLDEKKPGWFDRIKLRHLNMGKSDKCVIGQLYDGHYTKGVRELGMDFVCVNDSQYDHGFESKGASDDDYAEMTAAWKAEIKERRNGK